MSEHAWTKGQQVALNRQQIVTIDSVTKGGRAKIGNVIYELNGYERGQSSVWNGRNRIEPLTPETEAAITLHMRTERVAKQWRKTLDRIDSVAKNSLSTWRRTPSAEDVDLMERLTAAILAVLGPEK